MILNAFHRVAAHFSGMAQRFAKALGNRADTILGRKTPKERYRYIAVKPQDPGKTHGEGGLCRIPVRSDAAPTRRR